MLEDVELDQSVVSSTITISTETKVLEKFIEVVNLIYIIMRRINL